MSGNRTRKLQLFKANPKCCYCGITTRLISQKLHEVAEDDMATLEHLTDRFDEERFHKPKYAIACLKCNAERGKQRCKQLYDKMTDISIKYTNLLRVALLHKNKDRAMEIIEQVKSHIEQNL